MASDLKRGPLIAAGLLLGAGMGGFLDGIVLHQILQWHNMLSAKLPPNNLVDMEVNMFWDGMFHVFCWVMTTAGLVQLYRAGKKSDVLWSGGVLLGACSAGWGLFNLIEGVINHHILHLHHVTETENHLSWDLGFLASGVLLTLLGWILMRSCDRSSSRDITSR